MRTIGRATGLCVLVVFSAPDFFSVSALDRIPGIIGEDEREHVNESGAPWDAIGQVNISGYRTRAMCTGTLIGSDRAITAAHCLIDPRTNKPYAVARIHFLAGVRGSDYKAHATAKCVHFFASGAIATSAVKAADDAALIILNREISVPPARFTQSHSARRGQSLVHAAYGFDRRFGLSAHYGCRLTRIGDAAKLWFNDCDTSPASSGGPVFIETGQHLTLAAIMIAARGRRENVAWPLSNWNDLDLVSACSQDHGWLH